MQRFSQNRTAFSLSVFLFTAFAFAACQPPSTTVNTSNVVRNENTNTNSNLSNTNSANSNSTVSSMTIEAKEPEKYQATVTLKLEAVGTQQATALPSISTVVARSGNDKRMEFTLPNGEKVIYLDRGGQQLVISPQRKQYAELNKESLGFEVRQMLTPAQIVSQVKTIKGVERVGEEKFGGRDAIKYRYNIVTDTKSQAGNVQTDSVIFVDKETGLPLRSETVTESQTSSVSGVKSLRLVTEMSNLNLNVDQSLFAEPTDYKKVAPEEIRSQVDLIFSAIVTFLGQAMKTAQTATSPTASPTATATP